MKAILVIDMPKSCADCNLCGLDDADAYVCVQTRQILNKDIDEETTNRYCPLKPMPRKLDANDWHRMFGGLFSEREAKGYVWNACLDEILGE